jgi:hypothetical protein
MEHLGVGNGLYVTHADHIDFVLVDGLAASDHLRDASGNAVRVRFSHPYAHRIRHVE